MAVLKRTVKPLLRFLPSPLPAQDSSAPLPNRRLYSPSVQPAQPLASSSQQAYLAREPVETQSDLGPRLKGKERAIVEEPALAATGPLRTTNSRNMRPSQVESSRKTSSEALEMARDGQNAHNSAHVHMSTTYATGTPGVAERPLNSSLRRHPFNTHAFVENLVDSGISRERAEILMEAARVLAVQEVDRAHHVVVSKVVVENNAFLYSAALSELRTEVHVDVREETLRQRSANAMLHRRIESLSQATSEQVESLKSEIKYEFQHSRDETNADFKNLELRLSDVNNRISLMFGSERAEIESLRWIFLRNIFLSIIGFALFTVLINEALRERPKLPSVDEFGVHALPDDPSEENAPVRRVGEEPD